MYIRMIAYGMFFTSTKWSCINLLWHITVVIIFLFFVPSKAQVLQPGRYEIPLLHDDKFEIIPSGEYGLYLYRQFHGEGTDQLQIIRLDTVFQEKWGGLLPVQKNYM